MNIEWLEIADSPDVWKDVGFAVADGGHCVIGGVEHRFVGSRSDGRKGIVGWGVSGIDGGISEIDGIPTQVVEAHESHGARHPNLVSSIDHLVIRTSSTPRTAAALSSVGLERRGAGDSTSSGEAVDMTFFWAGKTLLEIIGPPTPSTEDRPARLIGLAYVSSNLDETAELLGDNCTTPKDAVQPGRRIAAVRKDAGLSVPVAFMTPHVKL